MRASYSPDYFVALPEGHPFPMGKFPALHAILLREGILAPEDIVTPDPASWNDLRLIHTNEYLDALRHGHLDRQAERRLGLPWSEALVHRSRVAVQGTIHAATFAMLEGLGANLAGGTHHAFPTHGEGFCVLNDVAVAIRVLQRSRLIDRALVLDLDVHQGNGTAAIFAGDPRVFTFSIHGNNNFPFRKERGSMDVGVEDGMDDTAYLATLETHLGTIIDLSRPDLVFYLAGVDPAQGDRYGRLCLTRRGLAERDRLVLRAMRDRGLPACLLLSGGYAKTPEETADLHAILHRTAREIFPGNFRPMRLPRTTGGEGHWRAARHARISNTTLPVE